MSGLTVVFGNGAVGHLVTEALAKRGDKVRVAQRHAPIELPLHAEYVRCDVLNADDVKKAVKGATRILLSVAFPYDSRIWASAWPTTMRNVVEAGAEVGARIVFIDNLYQLGPQTQPRREDMSLTNKSAKPLVLAEATRIWQAASGKVRFAALRCSDFYGPGVAISYLGATGFGQTAKGRAAQLVSPDTPHDFAYVPDIAHGAVILLDAPDDAFGLVWNMPCAPTRTPREILALGAAAIGKKPKVTAIPVWMLPWGGLVLRFLKEVADVSFTWDRPYQVDSSKFVSRFGFLPTPFEIGAPETARAFAAEDSSAGWPPY